MPFLSTSPRAPSDPSAPSSPEPSGLSLTQIIASVLATVTATAALSLLGVAGTVIGAALASVVTVVGNTLYARSIRRTRDGVLALRGTFVGGAGSVASTVSDAPPTSNATSPDPADAVAGPRRPSAWSGLVERHGRTRMLVAATVAMFVAILAVVTVVEVASGKPLADTVRNQPASGTSLFGGTTPTTAPVSPSTPTATPTTSAGDPAGSSPSVTTSPSDSSSPSGSPTAGDSASATPSDTSTPTTSASPSVAATGTGTGAAAATAGATPVSPTATPTG